MTKGTHKILSIGLLLSMRKPSNQKMSKMLLLKTQPRRLKLLKLETHLNRLFFVSKQVTVKEYLNTTSIFTLQGYA